MSGDVLADHHLLELPLRADAQVLLTSVGVAHVELVLAGFVHLVLELGVEHGRCEAHLL